MTAAPTAEIAQVVEHDLSSERILTILDCVPTIGKLATLAVLDQTPDDFVSSRDMSLRLEELQGRKPIWRFQRESPTMAYCFCEDLFARLGLAELGLAPGLTGTVRGARITSLGSKLWPAIAGAYLPWQAENLDIGIADVVGSSQQALTKGTSSRLRILDYVLNSDSNVSIGDIQKNVGVNMAVVTDLVAELNKIGVVTYEAGKVRPAERSFIIQHAPDVPSRSKSLMLPELRAAITGLEGLQPEVGAIINFTEIIKLAQQVDPTTDPRVLWDAWRAWLYNRRHRTSGDFIDEVKLSEADKEKRLVGIRDSSRPSIGELLRRRSLLAVDADYRAEMSTIGRALMGNKTKVLSAMRDAKKVVKRPTIDQIGWELTFLEHLPADGTTVDELYTSLCESGVIKVSKKSFLKRLRSLDNLLIIEDGRDEQGVLIKSFVHWKPTIFNADWEANARCRQANIDPDVFSPDETEPIDIQHAKTAEAVFHCLRCEVRQPCLAQTLEEGEQYSIRGGLIPARIQKVTGNQKRALLNITQIAPSQEV